MIEKVPRSARFWGWCFASWFALLTWMSSGDREPPVDFPFGIPHGDKIAHFGYFFGGGGLLAAALFYSRRRLSARQLVLAVTVILSLIGIYDEYHQSFSLNRSGNDPWDWLADTLGGLCGALVFLRVEKRLLRKA